MDSQFRIGVVVGGIVLVAVILVLGILLGVNFITTGFGYLSVSRAMKPLA